MQCSSSVPVNLWVARKHSDERWNTACLRDGSLVGHIIVSHAPESSGELLLHCRHHFAFRIRIEKRDEHWNAARRRDGLLIGRVGTCEPRNGTGRLARCLFVVRAQQANEQDCDRNLVLLIV